MIRRGLSDLPVRGDCCHSSLGSIHGNPGIRELRGVTAQLLQPLFLISQLQRIAHLSESVFPDVSDQSINDVEGCVYSQLLPIYGMTSEYVLDLAEIDTLYMRD